MGDDDACGINRANDEHGKNDVAASQGSGMFRLTPYDKRNFSFSVLKCGYVSEMYT
jgi:hypothetical protein